MELPCAWSDVASVRKEISEILPGAQVVEIADIAKAKTEARTHALEEGRAASHISGVRGGRRTNVIAPFSSYFLVK